MKIITTDLPNFSQPVVGNVYHVKGGYGSKAGHSMVLFSITNSGQALMLVIDRNGDPVGVTSYGIHALEERAPIAFVRGLDDISFTMERI